MIENTPVRVRFAPSPTGFLHTGGARTALFNWLWARKSGGRFILRIEDTDEDRSTEDSTRAILDGLLWLGLDWDEGPDPDPVRFGESIGPHGPYFQSKRAEQHLELVARLLSEGKAFYCAATEEEMTTPDGKRRLFSPYRDQTPEEGRKLFMEHGGMLPIRFKCPRGKNLEWNDIIRGPVSFQSDEVGDFIFVKSNGKPLYNFAVTSDDAGMEITHVLRGEDHISNTPKQILLYRALDFQVPEFGHAPLIVGMDGARLSKRHGATQVGAYRSMGILPEAMVNFLLLIGWAPKDNKEHFTRQEMLDYFNPHDINKSPGAFNPEKLHHFNGMFIRELEPADFFERLKPFMPAEWVSFRGEDYARQAVRLFQDKLVTLNEIQQNAWYFFRDPTDDDYNPKSVDKFLLNNPQAPEVIGTLYDQFSALSDAEWTEEQLSRRVDALCERLKLGKGKVMQPWRVALTGDKISPGFYDLVIVLGRETVLKRTEPWAAKLKQQG